MSIFYLDYVNGNDANDGSSWALAWKTITSGATAARIAPGDIIRIAKSPDPTAIGNATWTNLSKTVTLADALTADIELCETAWTPSANVTAITSTSRKQGSRSASFAIANDFTTGKVAYKAFAETDFSAYQQVSFWIRTSVAIAAGVLTLRLCSDATGDATVNTITIPAIPGTSRWQVVTVDTGGALGSSIQSVALYAESDPGTPTILLDNILACKASSTADSLTLSSLISKNGLAQGGTEGFYGIQSINGATVLLDNDTETSASAGRGYSGITETVTTYKRETIKTVTVGTGIVQEVQDSGSVGNLIEFQGGWNIVSTIQDGETFFDGQNCWGTGLQISSKSYIMLNRLSFCRYANVLLSSASFNTITLTNVSNNINSGIALGYSNNNTITVANANNTSGGGANVSLSYSKNNNITVGNANNGLGFGVYLYSSMGNMVTITNVNNSGSNNIYVGSSSGNVFDVVNARNGNVSCVRYDLSYDTILRNLSSSGNDSGISSNFGTHYLRNVTISEVTEVLGNPDFANARIYSWNHDDVTGNHWIFTDGGTINSQTATRHTSSGIAWKFAITSSNRSSLYPLKLKIAEVAVNANALVTVKAWLKKDHATNVAAKLVCPGGQLSGVPNDVTATKADDTNWEELTITFTPTESGVVEIEAQAYYVAGNSNVYVDDFSVTQE